MDDVIVIGAGLVGVATAVFLAEAGATVTVLERETVGAAASGRNAGSIQHPLDPERAPLYRESLEHYRRFGVLAGPPIGLLAVGQTAAAAGIAHATATPFAELAPERLDGDDLRSLEPELAEGLFGCLLQTGYPTHPAATTARLAEIARALGVKIEEGVAAYPVDGPGRRVDGVTTTEGTRAAGAVLVAAGPWTASTIDPVGSWRPVSALWGVTVEVALPRRLHHRIEEWEDSPGGTELSAESIFEATPLEEVTILGATRTAREPQAAEVATAVRERSARFLPVVDAAPTVAVRACARPLAADDRPLLGPLAERPGLHVAAGHGAYGISLGPASARIAADAILHGTPVPPQFAADRFSPAH